MKLVWLPMAVADRDAIYDFIDKESPDAAIVVDERISQAVSQLERIPEMGRLGRRKHTRELVIVGTPYIAAYMVEDGRIEVLRIVHGARRWPRKMRQP